MEAKKIQEKKGRKRKSKIRQYKRSAEKEKEEKNYGVSGKMDPAEDRSGGYLSGVPEGMEE